MKRLLKMKAKAFTLVEIRVSKFVIFFAKFSSLYQ